MKSVLPSVFRFCSAAALLLTCGLTAPAQDTATLTTLHGFTGVDGENPENLVEGDDGNFYGTTSHGGFNYNAELAGSGYGTVFRISPTGVLTTLYVFAGTSEGQYPGDLFKGTDGNLYGQASAGGADDGSTIFQITPEGSLTTIYRTDDPFMIGTLLQDSSGDFYGVTYGSSDYGSIYRLTKAGVYTTLHTFTGNDDGAAGSGLTRGSDGNFYGTSGVGGRYDGGTIYQISPAGVFKTLYSFTGDADGFLPGGLTLGADGNLYGLTEAGGSNNYGVVFRITNDGQFSVLYNFTGGSDGGTPVNDLVLGHDGNLYGIAAGDTQPRATATPILGGPLPPNPPLVPPGRPSVFFRVTPQGVLTPLYASANLIGGYIYGTDSFVQGRDGNFYGTSTGYEDDGRSAYTRGAAYKLVVNAHPAFFAGQAPLVNGVDYLAFPNGNFFGYYSFLSDANYLYHFDLGYEYVFDARDGKAGVYLYDFASNGFFYTSPTFPFPYLYDFKLNAVLYYYPDPNNAGRYNTNGVRYFYNFATGRIITK